MKVGVIFLIIVLILIGYQGFSQGKSKDIQTIDFENFSAFLTKENDTVYVINFWATWCAPCVEELPVFEQINQTFKNKSFKMLLISLDFKSMKTSRLIPFVEKNNLQATVIHLYEPDANSWINKIDTSWTGAIPATLVYKGKKRWFKEGQITYNELYQTINQLLK
jgi:thiol-disulfide isomerase/thioredoxin